VVPEIEQADLSQAGPNEWLLAYVPFTDAEMILSSVPADARIAEFLATSAGTSVMQIERTTWKQGVPVTFVRMTHHSGFQVRARY
jgi:GntR family histidine utilization transcriptional repressor